jgi:rhodanese-related sulfurtransferase
MIEEITVSELNKKISNKEDFILLDVRTDSEYYLSNIEGAIHIPMNNIPHKLDSLKKDKKIIVQCKSGVRSSRVCEFLLKKGYPDVKNLKGGIVAWAEQIDSSIIVY